MPSGTISRMSKMCVCRQICVIWAPDVDASGRNRLWCSVLNCKINTALWPSRGTPMKTAYCRLCIAIFAIYARRYTCIYDTSLKYYCCDLMATVTSAVSQKSAAVKLLYRGAFYPRWSDDDPFDTLGNSTFWYKQGIIQIDAMMVWNDLCLEYL